MLSIKISNFHHLFLFKLMKAIIICINEIKIKFALYSLSYIRLIISLLYSLKIDK